MTTTKISRKRLPESVLSAAVDGDANAWAKLFNEFRGRIGYLSRGSDVEAEDFVQTCFVDAFSARKQVRDSRKLGAWLMTIARNKRAAAFLDKKRSPIESLGPEHEGAQNNLEDPGVGPESLWASQEAVGRLSEEVRDCWVERHVHGYSVVEVAEHHNISLSTAKRRLRRARNRLQHLEQSATG